MDMQSETIAVEGMTCGGCVRDVKKALGAIEGVVIDDITFESVAISYDPAKVKRDDIVETIRDRGYGAK